MKCYGTDEDRKTCQEEKFGCEGCFYNKPLAMRDMIYCTRECDDKCDRHKSNWTFNDNCLYSFTDACIAREMEDRK